MSEARINSIAFWSEDRHIVDYEQAFNIEQELLRQARALRDQLAEKEREMSDANLTNQLLTFARDNYRDQLNAALAKNQTVLSLLGNLDHSIGHGGNAAKFRGQLLNDIREILQPLPQPPEEK